MTSAAFRVTSVKPCTLAVAASRPRVPIFIDKNLFSERLSGKKSRKRPTLMRFAAYARDGKRHIGMVEGARMLHVAAIWGAPARFRQIIDGGRALTARIREYAASVQSRNG